MKKEKNKMQDFDKKTNTAGAKVSVGAKAATGKTATAVKGFARAKTVASKNTVAEKTAIDKNDATAKTPDNKNNVVIETPADKNVTATKNTDDKSNAKKKLGRAWRGADKSFNYLWLFAIVFLALIGRAIYMGQSTGDGQQSTGYGLGQKIEKTNNTQRELNFSDVLNAADKKQIAKISVNGNDAVGEMVGGQKFTATIAGDSRILARIAASGASVSVEDKKNWVDTLGTWVSIILGAFFIYWIWKMMRGGAGGMGRIAQQMNPTKITVGASKTKVTFADVAGINNAKTEVQEVVDFLKNKDKYTKIGARIPRGILLSGEPGTGKTLLARAIAGEANVPFFSASGSDFSGIIVGLGVAKIKEIFEMARRNAPCILFVDEIDAIGMHRGRSSFNDNDREQTLNQLLIEMDGFAGDSGIIVIGATNRPDMLDPALLRPGRFDRQVYIELPDLTGRREILGLYAKKKKIAADVDLMDVARGTTGFSGADLENLLNEAALLSARENRAEITHADIEEARDKILMGPKKDRKIRPDDLRRTALHEAGHAFVSVHYADITDPIHKATIIPRGRALGMVQRLPIDDKVSMTLAEIRATLAIDMAGRAAEEVFYGGDLITTGAEADIAQATQLARYAITTAGLSAKIGQVSVNQVDSGWGNRRYLEDASDKTRDAVDAEVRAWIDAAHADAKKIITRGRAKMKKLADELLARETLTRQEIEQIISAK